MRHELIPKALTIMLAAACVGACSSQDADKRNGTPDPIPSSNDSGHAVADTPFTRKGTVVTATCAVGARAAGVSLQAWDSSRWELLGERAFAIPTNAAFTNYPGVVEVNSPLVDLCRQGPDEPSPYGADSLERTAPRVRALFDRSFTLMAVVLRDPNSTSTRAGVVAHLDAPDTAGSWDEAPADEQNAVMSPDGSRVWFTYKAASGEMRIGSRAVKGDHRLSDEGLALGHDVSLTILGQPPRAVQAEMVRMSPDGRRITAKAPNVFGHIFDTPDTSGPVTGKSARNAVLASGCLDIVGWIGDARVLCRIPSGSFQITDARSGVAVGAPIVVPDSLDSVEGVLVSADGKGFIVSRHAVNNRFGWMGDPPDFRVVPTGAEGRTVDIADSRLDATTIFLAWT